MLKPLPIGEIPPTTSTVAHAIYPQGNVVMQLREMLTASSPDEVFGDLFPDRGQPALAPWRLVMVLIHADLTPRVGSTVCLVR